uniref:C2 calcium/lipid-binding region, CaLB,IPR000008 C2 calcium-dependent membrane targeting,domain-containing protein n=1 Tax=Schistosoma japonicum TaxID=6182 RepID=C1LDU3_SCHJA|nr:C2 calcium/lipid-binding region, CaLB,IPR000008 C2 calcium-dependent membrane targeting,domain-containing protein [Schistosoma japonicum]
MTSEQSNIKDALLVKMSSQYDDPYLWINNYVTTSTFTNTEIDHLKSVMQRDQAIKKADRERIYDLVGSFPTKLQPEILRSNMNQLRNKYPAVPGSGFVSIGTSLIQSHDVDPIKVKEENLHLHYTRKRKSCVTFTKCKFQSTFSKLCPICLQTFNALLETNQCIQCGQNVCKNCAYKTASITNSDILCRECWDIARFMCKTGDWFNQYTKSKTTNPLKIDMKFKPLQNNKPCIESGELNPTGIQSTNYNANLSVEGMNENSKTSLNGKSFGENYQVMKKQILRSKSVQNLQTQSLLNDSKFNLQTTHENESSGFINRSVLSYSQSLDNLSRESDSSMNHKEFHSISKRKKRILKLKKLLKKSKTFKSDHCEASDEIDNSVFGEIDVSLEYNVQDQQLGVGLWNANKLISKTHKIGLPHATITLLPDNVKYSLKVTGHNKWDGRDAVFNQSVCFTVHKRDLNKKVVVIRVWSRKGIKSQFTIGQTIIPINECKLLLSTCRQIFYLVNQTNQIITNQSKHLAYYGEIKFAVRFVISDYQKTMLHISDEAIDLNGTLEVWIKEGKNLYSPKAGVEINSYVTVELTDAECRTEYQSSDHILRSDQPMWNSLVSFTNKYLSELIKSTMKILIWNRSSSLNEPELLGCVHISNREKDNLLQSMSNVNDLNDKVHQSSVIVRNSSLWDSITSKPGEWIETTLNIETAFRKS